MEIKSKSHFVKVYPGSARMGLAARTIELEMSILLKYLKDLKSAMEFALKCHPSGADDSYCCRDSGSRQPTIPPVIEINGDSS
jgi:hypothetical protein